MPALSDQAGEARNDIVGIFFLLAAVAVALNAWRASDGGDGARRAGACRPGPLVVVGLAAGLAAGTKLNFLLPAAVLVLGLAAVAPRGRRLAALAAAGLAALAGGGYWYLRNLVHTGNPLPWFHHLGPISLPAPEQALGGREAHSVLGYLTDGTVWSDWFLPASTTASGSSGRCSSLAAAGLASLGLAAPCRWRPDAERSRTAAGRRRPGRPRRRPRLADRADLGLRPRGDAARLRVRPPLPGPGPRPRPRPAARASPPLRDRLAAIGARSQLSA